MAPSWLCLMDTCVLETGEKNPEVKTLALLHIHTRLINQQPAGSGNEEETCLWAGVFPGRIHSRGKTLHQGWQQWLPRYKGLREKCPTITRARWGAVRSRQATELSSAYLALRDSSAQEKKKCPVYLQLPNTIKSKLRLGLYCLPNPIGNLGRGYDRSRVSP